MQDWVTPWEEGHQGKKYSGVEGAEAGQSRMGGKKRVHVLIDHRFQVIFLCNLDKKTNCNTIHCPRNALSSKSAGVVTSDITNET